MSRGDLKKLRRFFRESPRDFERVAANVLTSIAFSARKLYIENINRSMTVRNKRFVESSLRVVPARTTHIDRQFSEAGSIRRPRFSGWEEQQTGRLRKSNRAGTTAARGGDKKRQMLPRARLKRGNQFYKPEQFRARSDNSRFAFMMRVIASRGGGEFLLSKGHKSLPPGLYQFRNRRVRMLQKFGNVAQPRHIPWMSLANQSMQIRSDMAEVWRESARRVLQKYK